LFRSAALPLLALALIAPAPSPVAEALPNQNRHPAGRWSHDTLSVSIDARPAVWRPDSTASPPANVYAFAEPGGAPSIPGPLIRVREGSVIVVTLRNALADSAITVHGLMPHPAAKDDTVQIAAGAARVISFKAGAPGTYLYWASTDPKVTILDLRGADSQLRGVIVVDPAGGPPAQDRIFVITQYDVDGDSTKPKPNYERFTVAINGRAWPYTERLSYTQGDTVRMRWVDGGYEFHPMHLHGFYFRIDSRSSPLADTAYAPTERRWVVTERIEQGTAISMIWVPERPGNWLMHCHIFAHVEPDLLYPFPGDTLPHYASPTGHHPMDMSGLILGISVEPKKGVVPPPPVARRRTVRMVLHELPFLIDSVPAISIAFGDSATFGRTATRWDVPVPTLVLTRDEPVRIWVVNKMSNEAAIHWHGIELDSYYDGVPGWSGDHKHLAPMIASGDSFAVDMTPPRAGTFIYHSHVENGHHLSSGLYGALIVSDPAAPFDSTRDLVQLYGGGELIPGAQPYLNGSRAPPARTLVAGKTYRVRIVNILEDNSMSSAITFRAARVTWTPAAKDGIELPARDRTPRPAVARANVGETYDFEFTPADPGDYFFEVFRPGGVVMRQLWKVKAP
jgi:FtsP/CotA-like multicopper oxidase with cupredoxin domain